MATVSHMGASEAAYADSYTQWTEKIIKGKWKKNLILFKCGTEVGTATCKVGEQRV